MARRKVDANFHKPENAPLPMSDALPQGFDRAVDLV
jgi:hypothetical protein